MINIVEIKNADENYHQVFTQHFIEKQNEDFCFIIESQDDSYSHGHLGCGRVDTSVLDLPIHSCKRKGCGVYTGNGTFLVGLSIIQWANAGLIDKKNFIFFSRFFKDCFSINLDKPKPALPFSIKGRGLIHFGYSRDENTDRSIKEMMIPITSDARKKNEVVKPGILIPTSLEDEGIMITHEELSKIFKEYTADYFKQQIGMIE